MKLSDLGEGGLIDLIRDWTSSRPPVVVGVGDDAAVLEIGGAEDLVISTDASVENVHFRTDIQPADEIGHRAMTGALSDLAAMGATGIAAFVALHAPPDAAVEFVHDLYRGMERVASPAGVQVAGGDTVRGALALDITVVGVVPRGRAVLRSGAREGDRLYVSGALGRSEAGRRLLSGEAAPGVPARFRSAAESGHRAPRPRFDVSELLMRLPRRPTAMIDVSDGLAIDLRRLCEASGVGCSVEVERVPVDDAARCIAEGEGRDPLSLALEGGEDWELLFAIGAEGAGDLEEAARRAGLSVSAIGRILARREGMALTREDGSRRELPLAGWDHFARRS
jgi:thiamine-monophosphate kinase